MTRVESMSERDSRQLPGFQRLTRGSKPKISSEQRTSLVRRGNELFNRGKIEEAKRIFLTVSYTDGLIRLGNHHLKKNEPLEAFRMYWQAGATREVESMAERMAGVLKHWLAEDGTHDEHT